MKIRPDSISNQRYDQLMVDEKLNKTRWLQLRIAAHKISYLQSITKAETNDENLPSNAIRFDFNYDQNKISSFPHPFRDHRFIQDKKFSTDCKLK